MELRMSVTVRVALYISNVYTYYFQLFSLSTCWRVIEYKQYVYWLVKLFIAFDIVSHVVLYFIAEFVFVVDLKLLFFCDVFLKKCNFL